MTMAQHQVRHQQMVDQCLDSFSASATNLRMLSILISCRQSVLFAVNEHMHVQFLFFPTQRTPTETRAEASQYPSPVYKKRGTTYFELASILTDSFTCSRVGFAAEASFLPPPAASTESPTVPMRVPRARYSFLMARPKITLQLRELSGDPSGRS